jgi:uncharacterized caspase-like protein
MTGLGEARALLVGISTYHSAPVLPPTVAGDARALRDVLVDNGWSADDVTLLVDEEATRPAIEGALAALGTAATADTTVLVYFSGHGAVVDGAQLLLSVEADVSSPAAILATGMPGPAFREAVASVPARRAIVVLDCCHAGDQAAPKDLTPVFEPAVAASYVGELATGGRVVLASCRPDERSWVLPGAPNSVFTTRVLQGIATGVPTADGLVRVFDLFEYVQPLVTADEAKQHPVFQGTLEESFPLAARPARPVGPATAAAPVATDTFLYDAYLSFADVEPDATYVWSTLLPALQAAGLRIAVSSDVEEPGVGRVVNAERGIERSKRTVVALSPAYLGDRRAQLQNELAQDLGVEEGVARLLPVKIAPIDDFDLPQRLAMLTSLDLVDQRRGPRNLARLIAALQGPLPQAGE